MLFFFSFLLFIDFIGVLDALLSVSEVFAGISDAFVYKVFESVSDFLSVSVASALFSDFLLSVSVLLLFSLS